MLERSKIIIEAEMKVEIWKHSTAGGDLAQGVSMGAGMLRDIGDKDLSRCESKELNSVEDTGLDPVVT